MVTSRWYRIDINAHKVNPDLYVWTKLTGNIFPAQNCETKAIKWNKDLVIFVNNGLSTQIYTSKNGTSWTKSSTPITGLPTPCYVKDIVQHNDCLYYIDKGVLYTTNDLYTWTSRDYSTAEFMPINMLLSYNDTPWCILQDCNNHQLMLGTITGDSITKCTNIVDLKNGYLPNTFPISDFAASTFESSSERPRAMIVGGRQLNGNPINSRWNLEYIDTENIYRLKDFTISQPKFHTLTGASIIQYNNQLMMFGGIDNDLDWNSNILYSDDEGMNWYIPDTASNQLPAEYESRQNQSVVVDDNNIYIIGGQSHSVTYSDVYLGRLNSLL
jgi:hypothetical protein